MPNERQMRPLRVALPAAIPAAVAPTSRGRPASNSLRQDLLAAAQNTPMGGAVWGDGMRGIELGSTAVNRAFTPPSEQPQRGAAMAGAALAAGRQVVQTPLTPQEKMLAHLDTLLSRPMTLRGMQAVSGALQETSASAPRGASAKDNVLASTAEISRATYDGQIKDILAQRAAGSMTIEQAREATSKATDAYFLRNTALVGNPLSFAQANMLPPPTATPEE